MAGTVETANVVVLVATVLLALMHVGYANGDRTHPLPPHSEPPVLLCMRILYV